jgi:zinc/manganese transport system substrate-binding protein
MASGKALALLFLLLWSPLSRAEAPLQIVASFSILADLAQQVGQERVEVTALVPAGRNLHQFQPKPADAKLLAHADLVLINGLGTEGWLDQLVRASGFKGRILQLGQTAHLRRTADGAIDPHSWQEIANVRAAVAAIAESLAALRPDQAESFRAQAARYDQTLAALDAWVRQEIGWIPAERRVLVVPHDAFGYFADAYQLRILPLQGASGDTEPTARRFAELSKAVRGGQITALFGEINEDNRPIKQLAKESGGALAGELYADSLSPAGGPADSYERLMRHNVGMMVQAMESK